MYKIIFDADALIKLVKAGFPKRLFGEFKSFITEEVYKEAVIEGKDALFEDAFMIEDIVKEGLINRVKTKKNAKISALLESEEFGKGEESVLHLYAELKANAICSDDKKFLNFLYKNKISFILPIDLIVSLKEVKKLDRKDASKIIDKLRPFIKEDMYLKFKKQMGEKK